MPGRRVSLASLADRPVEEVPGQDSPILQQLRPDQIAPTPLNKRENFGTDEELAALGESLRVRQLAAVVVVERSDYLRLWPDHEEQLGAAGYVLVNGERRWRAATTVSLPTLEAMVRPGVAASREDFLDALYAENLERKNFDIIEEARAVDEMVKVCGSALAAAKRFRRTEGWVSQHRALLRLTPELQEHVRSGELPVRIARTIAALPHDKQRAAWQAAREAESADRESRRQVRATSPDDGTGSQPPITGTPPEGGAELSPPKTPAGDGFTAVKTGDVDATAPGDTQPPGNPGPTDGDSFTAVKTGDTGTPPPGEAPPGTRPVVEGNSDEDGGDGSPVGSPNRPAPVMVRWDDLGQVAGAIRAALSPAARRELAALITSD